MFKKQCMQDTEACAELLMTGQLGLRALFSTEIFKNPFSKFYCKQETASKCFPGTKMDVQPLS